FRIIDPLGKGNFARWDIDSVAACRQVPVHAAESWQNGVLTAIAVPVADRTNGLTVIPPLNAQAGNMAFGATKTNSTWPHLLESFLARIGCPGLEQFTFPSFDIGCCRLFGKQAIGEGHGQFA